MSEAVSGPAVHHDLRLRPTGADLLDHRERDRGVLVTKVERSGGRQGVLCADAVETSTVIHSASDISLRSNYNFVQRIKLFSIKLYDPIFHGSLLFFSLKVS